MFQVGKTYDCRDGSNARVICIDSPVPSKPIVAIVNHKSGFSLGSFTENGRFSDATIYDIWDLFSDEPTPDEAELISQIGDYCERRGEDREALLLNIVRKLRRREIPKK